MTRISTAQLHDSAVAHLQRASVAMARAQEQAATNRRILRPSDDPVAFRQAVMLRDAIGELEQYARNADVADRITKVADDAIGTAADVLIRAKEIAIAASNSAVGASERVAMAQEIEQIAKHLVGVANTKIGDAYLFSGLQTLTAPYVEPGPGSATVGAYIGDAGSASIPVGGGGSVPISIDGSSGFAQAFAGLAALHTDLMANSIPSGATFTALDAGFNDTIALRGQIGARQARVDLIRNELADATTSATALLSTIEDADMAETIVELTKRERSYQAAINVTSKLIGRSLWDEVR